jgi:hypothetical protein
MKPDIMAIDVRSRGRGSAALCFIAALAVTCACGSRTTPAAGPTSEPAAEPQPPPAAVAQESPPPAAPIPQPPTLPPAAAGRAPEPDADECALIVEPGEPIETVALTGRVDPGNAPRPSNDAEALVFRQLYETLVRVDCRGRVVPALAASWRLEADGRTWIVTLRDGARFSDGEEVTAADVRAAWTRDPRGDALRPQASRLLESVALAGDRALAITLRSRSRMDAPMALAHRDLAVAKPVDGSPWPIGTRPARIAPDGRATAGAAPDRGEITIDRDGLPPLRLRVAPGDPRDLLDRGADLLITRDPAALGYAATLPQFQSVALEWRHTYLLVMPGRARALPSPTDDQREALAADAVRGESRGARAPFWWQAMPDCPTAPASPQTRSALTPRIVYDAGDGTARDLAERLVGLGRVASPPATALLDVLVPERPRRSFQRVAGLSGAALALARRQGADAGYVMMVERQPIDPCRDMQILMEGAGWIDPETLVPLVETRMRAIVRRGRSGVAADWNGGVVLAGGGGSR